MGDVVQFRQDRRKLVAYVVVYVLLGVAVGFLVDLVVARHGLYSIHAAVTAVLVVFMIVTAVGSLRMSVEFDESEIRVRGFLLRRRVPRAQVRGVRGPDMLPLLEWVDARGRTRWSLVCAIESYSLLDVLTPGESLRRDDFVQQLEAWADGGASDAGALPQPA